jgi:hypothetical protein
LNGPFLFLATFLAATIERVEMAAILVGVGTVRGWRPTIFGAGLLTAHRADRGLVGGHATSSSCATQWLVKNSDLSQTRWAHSGRVEQVKSKRPAMFRGRHFQDEIIVLCVRWHLRYSLSYPDLDEIMAERGLSLDHSTIARWVGSCRRDNSLTRRG